MQSDRSSGLRSGNIPGWENLAIGALPMRGGRPMVAGWTIMVDTERRGSRIKWRPRAVRAWRRIDRAMVHIQKSPGQRIIIIPPVRCQQPPARWSFFIYQDPDPDIHRASDAATDCSRKKRGGRGRGGGGAKDDIHHLHRFPKG